MPELPDVEGFRRHLERHAKGRRIERAEVLDAELLRNRSPRALGRALEGSRFATPRRHGKWLIAPTGDVEVLLHFGMTGLLSWSRRGEDRHPHDRIVFVCEGEPDAAEAAACCCSAARRPATTTSGGRSLVRSAPTPRSWTAPPSTSCSTGAGGRSRRRGQRWLTRVRDDRGAACPRCGTRLRRATVAGRTACWCPRCQRGGRWVNPRVRAAS